MSCEHQRDVQRHFDGDLSVDDEHRFRAHLASCAECKSRYEGRLALSRLLAGAPTAQDRLARGLGLSVAAPPGERRRTWGWSIAAVSLAGLCLVVAMSWRASLDQDDGFTPRGAPAAELSPSFEVYRAVGDGGAFERAPSRIDVADELAFSYRNPTNRTWLMVFAVDSTGHIFWYYPEWRNPAENPRAIHARPGAVTHELLSAIAQPLAIGPVAVHALFLDRELSVVEVEKRFIANEPVVHNDERDVVISVEVTR